MGISSRGSPPTASYSPLSSSGLSFHSHVGAAGTTSGTASGTAAGAAAGATGSATTAAGSAATTAAGSAPVAPSVVSTIRGGTVLAVGPGTASG